MSETARDVHKFLQTAIAELHYMSAHMDNPDSREAHPLHEELQDPHVGLQLALSILRQHLNDMLPEGCALILQLRSSPVQHGLLAQVDNELQRLYAKALEIMEQDIPYLRAAAQRYERQAVGRSCQPLVSQILDAVHQVFAMINAVMDSFPASPRHVKTSN